MICSEAGDAPEFEEVPDADVSSAFELEPVLNVGHVHCLRHRIGCEAHVESDLAGELEFPSFLHSVNLKERGILELTRAFGTGYGRYYLPARGYFYQLGTTELG